MLTVRELRQRAADRLGIAQLNAMQQTTSAIGRGERTLLLAPTGAGKTLAFAVPFLASLPAPDGNPCGLIITPTRELTVQIYETVRSLAAPDYKCVAFYGGHNMQTEINSLSGRPDIVVATPGRVLDHLKRGGLSLHGVRSLVLDEYDKALELGFQTDMKSIAGRLRSVETLILTSATKAPSVPEFIDVKGLRTLDFFDEATPAPNLDVVRIDSADTDKLNTLGQVLERLGGRTLVFVNHREAAERVVQGLSRIGVHAGLYHGALEQDDRERALILFANGTTPVLVATDLAARGLDIPQVETVVHYHLPVSPEVWTHRNGRSGRQGAPGSVIAIINDKDRIPAFATFDRTEMPTQLDGGEPLPQTTTLYINAGRKEKISRGDVAGFILSNSPLTAAELGRIDLRDHAAYAAVPATKARQVVEALKPFKLKNKKVRVSQIKG